MIVTPFGGLSLLINFSILALRRLTRPFLYFHPRYAIQAKKRFVLPLIIMVATTASVFTSAVLVLVVSVESPYSNAHIAMDLVERYPISFTLPSVLPLPLPKL